MTPDQKSAAIHVAFYKEETMPKETELKAEIVKKAHLVIPWKEAMAHVAADLIMSYKKYVCPTYCGPKWTKEHIEAAILKGSHPLAHFPAALQYLLKETDEKVKNGYAKVMRYGYIMHALPSKLKCSSVAMIPHKSKSFRTRSSKEGRRNQDQVRAVSWRNKIWFCRIEHASGRLSKKGNHARYRVDISSTWHPCHVWPSHWQKNKQDQQGEKMSTKRDMKYTSVSRMLWSTSSSQHTMRSG